jgi:hypothetical protein
MKEYVYIGSAPYEEDCVQLDPKVDYVPAMKAECRRFIEAIRKVVGVEPEGARLTLKCENHDFGPYYEVVCEYDTENELAAAYAFRCEVEAPAYWPDGV